MVALDDVKEVAGYTFHGFGGHHNSYLCSYLTAAAAVGMTEDDVDVFIKRLDKVLHKCCSSPNASKDSQNASGHS